jgi:hypothetical protein
MNRTTVFLGDSHTCGYDSIPGKIGPGSYSMWNDNNYAELYGLAHNRQTAIYAVPGSCNRIYPDWLKSMFERYPDTDEVFVCLSAWNRFILAYNKMLSTDVLPVDYFTKKVSEKHNGLVHIYQDELYKEDRFQLFNKPHQGDFKTIPGAGFDKDHALIDPDIRKDNFMKVKLFFDLNTHLEQRDFFKDIYLMDRMCTDNACSLYLFNMTDRMKFPDSFEFYGKLKSTVVAPLTVESYFRKKMIDHTKHYTSDNEHYNHYYHSLIAGDYLEWLKEDC